MSRMRFSLQGWHYVLLAVAGALVAVTLLSSAPYSAGPFTFSARVSAVGRGVTEVQLPPLGTVRAITHRGLVDLTVALERVDVDLLSRLPARDPGGVILAQTTRDAERAVRLFAVRLLLLAFIGGFLAARIAGVRSLRKLAVAGLVGLGAVGLLVGLTVLTYDVSAFNSPQYSGVLSVAPWLLDALSQSVGQVGTIEQRVGLMADNVYRLFRGIEALEPVPRTPAGRRVLIISDIHNNPVGVAFVSALVPTFGVDLVLDAGDLTDFGTALESELVAGITGLGVPYAIALGNHDAPTVYEQLGGYPNVHFLSGHTLLIDGVGILGSPDPSAADNSPAIPSGRDLDAQVEGLRAALDGGGLQPFFLVAHNPLVGRAFLGHVPVIVSGHTHRVLVREERGSLHLNPGTTGAAGIRGLEALTEQRYTALLVHLVPGEDNPASGPGRSFRVKAVDILSFEPVGKAISLERRLFDLPVQDP